MLYSIDRYLCPDNGGDLALIFNLQLKKLINKLVNELASLGLSPTVLQELLREADTINNTSAEGKQRETEPSQSTYLLGHPPVVYEFNGDADHIQPRLRLWVNIPDPQAFESVLPSSNATQSSAQLDLYEESAETSEADDTKKTEIARLIWTLQRSVARTSINNHDEEPLSAHIDLEEASTPTEAAGREIVCNNGREIIIPLVYDSAFFQLLSTALHSLSEHLAAVHLQFSSTLEDLSRSIAGTARPASSTRPGFRPYSHSSDAANISVRTPSLFNASKVSRVLYQFPFYSLKNLRVIFTLGGK